MLTKQMTKQQARDFLVQYQMIHTNQVLEGKEGIKQVFNKLRAIQYDPLHVVGRNSDLVIHSRVEQYDMSLMDELLYDERVLLDAWDKMMGIILTEDFPKFRRIRESRAEKGVQSFLYYLKADALQYIDHVTEYITKHGPAFSKDIDFGERIEHDYGSTKITSASLDHLFHTGKIGVQSRKNTQKKYDLMERLIGDIALSEDPFQTEDDFTLWYFKRRIDSLGLFWNKNGVHFVGNNIEKKTIRTKLIKRLLEEEYLIKITVEGIKEPFYTTKKAFEDIKEIQPKISFIAPLDNLIWDRDLIETLFDFNYRWEVYTPLKKRQYGYYVLPILYGSNFIGRIEFEKQRKTGPLTIKDIWWEDNVELNEDILLAFNQALLRTQQAFNASKIVHHTNLKIG